MEQGEHEKILVGKRVLITAGPTREAIDGVRYISNYSSGKMGFALAKAAREQGAEVVVVAGPVSLHTPEGVRILRVESAREMLAACEGEFPASDITICAAAVADYRPANPASEKLKKGRDDERLRTLHLVENPDILRTLAHEKSPRQLVVGFAAETDDVIENAKAKLASKGADLIVANEVGRDKTFGKDESRVWLVAHNGVEALDEMTKEETARIIVHKIALMMEGR